MNEKDMDKALEEFRDRIYVNHELKHKLRENFRNKRRLAIKGKMRITAVAAVICLIISTYAFLSSMGSLKVSAASLNVENYTSMMSIGDGRNIAVSEYKGTIYMPGYERGILTYDSSGIKRLYQGNTSFLSVSGGGKIAFTEEGSIKIYHIDSGMVDEILRGEEGAVNYDQPSWFPDESAILYTKNTMEKNEQGEYVIKESEICKYDFNKSESTKIADGIRGSFIKGKNSVVFERDEKIFYKSLEDGDEKFIEEGSYPSASPDGRYIAFIKWDISTREIEKDVIVEQGLQNIYIGDTGNLNVRKKVTFNIPLIDIDEKEWLANLDKSNPPNILSYSGKYCYLYPAWSGDSKSIIAMRIEYPSDPRAGRIKQHMVRITMNKTMPSAKGIASNYLKAMASGDEDYAGSFTEGEHQDRALKGFNITGYNVISSDEKKGYADAEVYYGRQDNVYTIVEKSRYYTGEVDGRTVITGKKVLSSTEVFKDDNTIYIKKGGEEKSILLSPEDMPKQYFNDKPFSITSLAYSSDMNTLYFTLDNSGDKKAESSVKLIVYDINAKAFTIIDEIDYKDGDIKVNKLVLGKSGEFAALEYLAGKGESAQNITRVYGIKDKMMSILNNDYKGTESNGVSIGFWSQDELVVGILDNNQILKIEYNPIKMTYEIIG